MGDIIRRFLEVEQEERPSGRPVEPPVWSGGPEDVMQSSWEHTRSIRDSLSCPKPAHTPPAESEKIVSFCQDTWKYVIFITTVII